MGYAFIPADAETKVASRAIREQIECAPPSRGASQYVVYRDGREVAFVSLDHFPDSTDIVIYEIFVDPAWRNRGIGTAIMKELELMALRRRCTKIMLCPQPLDSSISRDVLVRWYNQLGYRRSARSHDVMEKRV
jgi:GNAT superfamily N-acetyltransferase